MVILPLHHRGTTFSQTKHTLEKQSKKHSAGFTIIQRTRVSLFDTELFLISGRTESDWTKTRSTTANDSKENNPWSFHLLIAISGQRPNAGRLLLPTSLTLKPMVQYLPQFVCFSSPPHLPPPPHFLNWSPFICAAAPLEQQTWANGNKRTVAGKRPHRTLS